MDNIVQGAGYGRREPDEINVLKADGSLARSDEEKAEVGGSHLHGVFNNVRKWSESALLSIRQRPTLQQGPPTRDEIDKAIRKLQSGKAPGESGVTPDFIKALDDTNRDLIHSLVLHFWHGGDFDEWHEQNVKLIRKPGKKSYLSFNSYRAICLKDVVSKVLSSVLSSRLLVQVQAEGTAFQFGGLPKMGTADALSLLINYEHRPLGISSRGVLEYQALKSG